MKWHFSDLEIHVILVFLYPVQHACHRGGGRGKRRWGFHADEAAQWGVRVLVKIVSDGALRLEGLVCFQCNITQMTFKQIILVIPSVNTKSLTEKSNY